MVPEGGVSAAQAENNTVLERAYLHSTALHLLMYGRLSWKATSSVSR